MTITNGYGDLRGYKLRYYDGDTDDDQDDLIIESAIEAVSRLIDDLTNRRFYAATETRYFTAERADYLSIPDLISLTTLKTDEDGDRTYETTWDTGDYDLMPFNAQADTANVRPYTWLEITPLGDEAFPVVRRGVEVAGSWGYAATPPKRIQEACYLGAHRIMKRHNTPLGVSATAALGQLQVAVRDLEADPDFLALIAPFRRVA